jgi:cell division septation protein DedD
MNFNSSGYFAYKKNKIQREIEGDKKPISRFSFLLQLFVVTFVVIFIIIVVSIMKYSANMDIEYTKGELEYSNGVMSSIPNYNITSEEEPQRKIDKRLMQIQQEENAPSEARIIEKVQNNPEVISGLHLENNKKIEKLEKQKKINSQTEPRNSKLNVIIEDVKIQPKISVEQTEHVDNVTIMSKVLIGRYTTFEEAQKLVGQIKEKNHKLQPFVRKIGNVFSVQMGSYQDFNVAKNHAQSLRGQGFDVWIYQQ